MTPDVDDTQERKHVLCVCHSLMVYHLYAKREISRQVHYFLHQFIFSSANYLCRCRMRSCFDLLTDEDKTWLLEPVETRMGKMIRAVETNQALLDILLLSQQEELLIDEVRSD